MKKSIRPILLGGAILFALSMCLTSCEGALDDLFGEWDKPAPSTETPTPEPETKPTATITTAPTAATGTINAASTTALVTAGAADGGTMMYVVTTTNTQPTSTDGFSATVPTAESFAEPGTCYVWYYAKADDNHTDSEISATAINVAISYKLAASATTTDKGRLICTDGHIHTYSEDAECTKDRVAKIIYVGPDTENVTYTHGLALALADEGKMTWSDAVTACSTTKNANTPVTGALWMLPSYYNQWNTMATAAGGYAALRDGFTSVGGTDLQSSATHYWTSSEIDGTYAWGYLPDYGNGSSDTKSANYWWARACLVF